MRIIAGDFKGRKLKPLKKGFLIRPTSDKVREAIFSILGPLVYNARILDLFAGTGAMGLEAVSRGAKSVLFVDNARPSLGLIDENITLLKVERRCSTRFWDIGKNLQSLRQADHKFDIVFIDPPYGEELVVNTLQNLEAADCLNPDAIVICEHSPKESVSDTEKLTVYDQRRYGKTLVTFFEYVV